VIVRVLAGNSENYSDEQLETQQIDLLLFRVTNYELRIT